MVKIDPSEITPEHLYMSRRRFIKGVGALVAGSVLLGACGSEETVPTAPPTAETGPVLTPTSSVLPPLSGSADELGADLTSYNAVVNYNNYYEFTTNKEAVAKQAQDLTTSPWAVTVGGLVNKPKTFDLDELLAFTQEERVYRLRCVEAWSMVIPWVGFPLAKLLDAVEPQGVGLAFAFRGFMWCAVNTFEQAKDAVANHAERRAGLVLDTFDLHATGVRPEELKSVDPARIFMMRLSDCEDVQPAVLSEACRVLPGEGAASLDDMLKAVCEAGYSGPVSMKIPSPKLLSLDPCDAAKVVMAVSEQYLPGARA